MFLANKLNKGAGTPAPTIDAQFNYVTMLLHGDGTNGAQNNTFVDSSTNNFSITRNGNATQGSFGPYGSNWSNYFNGSTDYLTFPNDNAFAFGTGSYTIEFWINGPLNNDKFILGGRNAITVMHITTGGSGSTAGVLRYVGTSTIVSSNVITDNTWHHCAIVRNGSSNITLYVDGVSVGTGTDTSNYTQASGTWYVSRNDVGAGNYLDAYLSNLRIVKGTAVYTSNFTPSTTPLTAISGTSLLTCQSNRFVDNSTNNFAVTLNSTPSVQRFNPFGTSTAYSTSVIGGSGYFDGNGDYVSLASNAAFQFGTGDFTVEGWFYQTADNSYPTALELGDHISSNAIIFITKFSGNAVIYSGAFVGSTPTTLNQWNHIAWVRSSGSLKIYVNGVSPAGVAFTNNLTNTTAGISIGDSISQASALYDYSGYISNLRVVKGTAVYTANFTPPTTPLTAISGTSLLTNFTNGAIIDNAMISDLETVGNAQISTSVKKYGTGSIALDGTGDYLISNAANTNLYAFSSGDFTIEFWIYPNSVTGIQIIYDGRPTSTSNAATPTIYLNNASIRYYVNGGDAITGSNLTVSTWNHIAICRSGTSTKLFLNGTQSGSTYTDSTVYINYAQRPVIGIEGNTASNFYNGYIDDLRVTKGYARYTANFTAPTAALSDIGPN